PLLVPARSPLAERHVPELEAGVASGEDLREVRLGGPRRRRQRHRHQQRDRDRPHPWLSVAQRSSVASAAPSSIAHAAFRIPYTKFGATPDATSASAASIRTAARGAPGRPPSTAGAPAAWAAASPPASSAGSSSSRPNDAGVTW